MEEADQRNEEIFSSGTERKVTSGSWNVRKRLYPPFRGREKGVRAEKDEQSRKKFNERSVSEPSDKFRLTVCLRKKQFPLVCSANIHIDNGRMMTAFANSDTSCVAPIFNQDNEPCSIRYGMSPSNDVCQDSNKFVDDDGFDLASDSLNKSESQCCMTFACGESIDYVICESCTKESSSSTLTVDTKDVEDALLEYLGAKEYSEFQEDDYEHSDATSKQESKSDSESIKNLELLQDPLVSHHLTMPYKEMPLSRYRIGGPFNDFEKILFLAKRPQSPVRDIPEGRFDVRARIAEVTRRGEIHNAKNVQRISKESTARAEMSDFMSPTSDSDQETLTILLQALLDDVKLSPSEYENDLSMTLTTVWAIKELQMSKTGSKVTQSVRITNLGIIPKVKRSLSYNLTLLTAAYFEETSEVGYPPRGSGNHSLHRALPWVYLCAAHAESEQKAHDTVRTCIDKVTPQIELKKSRIAYTPDINCPHLKEPVTFGRHQSR